MNLPNRLTVLRIMMAPVFIACFYLPKGVSNFLAAAIFTLAYVTDILDGRLARKKNIVTDFGKLIDPIADKILTCSALVMLVFVDLCPPVAAIIIMSREFAISGVRLLAAGKDTIIPASYMGKLKTVTQYIAIILLLIWPYLSKGGFPLDRIMLWLSVAITLVSGFDYLKKNKEYIDYKA